MLDDTYYVSIKYLSSSHREDIAQKRVRPGIHVTMLPGVEQLLSVVLFFSDYYTHKSICKLADFVNWLCTVLLYVMCFDISFITLEQLFWSVIIIVMILGIILFHLIRRTLSHFLAEVSQAVTIPVLIGSGVTLSNVEHYLDASAMIIGSYFKKGGYWANDVDPERVKNFMGKIHELRGWKQVVWKDPKRSQLLMNNIAEMCTFCTGLQTYRFILDLVKYWKKCVNIFVTFLVPYKCQYTVM